MPNIGESGNPPVYWKARQRVVEEMAIREIIETIDEGGNVELPKSWWEGIKEMKAHIYELIRVQCEIERNNP